MTSIQATPAIEIGAVDTGSSGTPISKRLDALPHALAAARADVPGFEAIIAGSGPETDAARRAVEAAGVADAVRFAGRVPDDELDKITYQNAMRWYSYDPFAHIPKEQATVAALRARAVEHDVAIRSFDKGRFEISHTGVDLATITGRATA